MSFLSHQSQPYVYKIYFSVIVYNLNRILFPNQNIPNIFPYNFTTSRCTITILPPRKSRSHGIILQLMLPVKPFSRIFLGIVSLEKCWPSWAPQVRVKPPYSHYWPTSAAPPSQYKAQLSQTTNPSQLKSSTTSACTFTKTISCTKCLP